MFTKTKKVLTAFLLLLIAAPILAQPIQGELGFGLGYQWDSDNKELSHKSTDTDFKLAIEGENANGRIHFSAKGARDWKAETGKFAIDELWFKGYKGNWDFSLGKQQLSWGTADGFNPTNYFGRFDSEALISGDLGQEAIWSGEAIYYAPTWSLTFVLIPEFAPQVIDENMREMMLGFNPLAGIMLDAIDAVSKPDDYLNPEFALRAETQLGGFDLQASLFAGFEPLPGMYMVMMNHPILGEIPIGIDGKYRRQYFGGLATTGTVGPMGVWAEVSYGGPDAFEKPTSSTEIRKPLSVNEKYFQAVVGGDYTLPLGKGILIQGQYIYQGQGSLLNPFPGVDDEPEKAHYLYGRLGYDFTPDSALDAVVLHGTKEKGGLLRPSYSYRFPNGISLEFSIVKTYGEGEFAELPPQARLFASYKF